MNTESKQKKVANRLYEQRMSMGLSQDALARKAGLDRKTVNRIENHHFSPNMDTLFRLCNVLRVKAEDLVKGL